MKEAILKGLGTNTRVNKAAIAEAYSHTEKALTTIKRAVGTDEDEANYHVAKALLAVGETMMEKKEMEAAEKNIHKAQRMIGERFSDNHPVIISFNASLIEVYSQSENQEKM